MKCHVASEQRPQVGTRDRDARELAAIVDGGRAQRLDGSCDAAVERTRGSADAAVELARNVGERGRIREVVAGGQRDREQGARAARTARRPRSASARGRSRCRSCDPG
jgi:hypothetical protein